LGAKNRFSLELAALPWKRDLEGKKMNSNDPGRQKSLAAGEAGKVMF